MDPLKIPENEVCYPSSYQIIKKFDDGTMGIRFIFSDVEMIIAIGGADETKIFANDILDALKKEGFN